MIIDTTATKVERQVQEGFESKPTFSIVGSDGISFSFDASFTSITIDTSNSNIVWSNGENWVNNWTTLPQIGIALNPQTDAFETYSI